MNEVDMLRNSSLVREKHLANGISSFNFSNKCFFNQAWDSINVKTRGLFVNDNKVVARSYNKFLTLESVLRLKWLACARILCSPCAHVSSLTGFLR